MEVLPPSERPAARGEWRRLAEQALADGEVHHGTADTAAEARLIVKRIRRAATVLGAVCRASYTAVDGKNCWYVRVSPKKEKKS